ncbi:MAG: Fe-S oxidoreductase [Sphingomonadaceae bacterium]
MKSLAIFAAMTMAAGAFAQTTPPVSAPPATDPMPAPAPAPTGDTEPADPAMPMPGAEGNAPVPPAPAAEMPTEPTAPAGTPQPPTVTDAGQPMTAPPPPPPLASYPRCSRTVTDSCVQDMSRESDRRGGPPARKRSSRRG